MYLFMFAVQCVIPTYIFTSHVLICVFDFNACFALRAIFKHWFRAMTQMMCYSLCCCWMFLVSPDLGVSVGLTVSKWYRWIRIFCLTTVRNLHKSWIMVQWNKIRCFVKGNPSWRGRWVRFHWTAWKKSMMDPEFPEIFVSKNSTNHAMQVFPNFSRYQMVTKRPLHLFFFECLFSLLSTMGFITIISPRFGKGVVFQPPKGNLRLRIFKNPYWLL